MNPSLVLENELLLEFENFKRGEKHDKKTIQQLLHYYKAQHIFNKEQKDFLSKNKIELEEDELDIWIESGWFDLSFEELVKYTKFKIILSKNKSKFPFVNIFKDKLENNFTATFIKNEERLKAKEHFKALFNEAQSLFIYDKYLLDNQNSFKKFAEECFPKRALNIFYPASLPFKQELRTHLKAMCKDWQVKQNQDETINNNYTNLHDRYIIIDKKIQVILTSGIDYLMDTSKDFTYIVREIK